MNEPNQGGSYHYTDLSIIHNEIRLLDLKPGSCDDQICCSLRQVSLSDDLQYTALSYTWGDPVETRLVLLDGFLFKVTVNLRDALLHLRDEAKVRTFWIDAICINQGNLSERGKQVLRMRYIYAKADRVEVWLGTANENEVAAMGLVRRLGQMVPDPEELLFQGLGTEYKEHFTKEFEQSSPVILKALDGLFSRQWWTRVWVVQELSVAKQANATITCGNATVRWIDFLVAAYAIEYCWFIFNETVQAEFPEVRLDGFQNGIRMSQCRHVRATDPAFRLLELLGQHRDCNATDPRDHIYGLLGMSGDGEDMGIEPDYSKTTQAIYTGLSRVHIEATGSLDMICTCQAPRNFDDLPSWVPDWSMDRQTAVLCVNERYCYGDSFPGSPSRNVQRYCTAGQSIAEVQFSDDSLRMSAKGFKLGHITMLGSTDDGMTFEDIESFGRLDTDGRSASDSAIFNEWFNMILENKEVTERYSDSESIIDVFYRMLVANRNNRMMKPSCEHSESASEHSTLFNRNNTGDDDSSPDYEESNTGGLKNPVSEVSSLGSSEEAIYSPVDALRMTEAAFRSCIQICFGKRLAILDNGSIGLVPEHSDIGDVISVLLGCSMPIVFRKADLGVHTLVGECYIHGVMEGELMLNQNSHILEDIVIK